MFDAPLEEQFVPTNAALLQRWLPWLRVLRGFRIAIGLRPLLWALLGVMIWSAGDWGLAWLPWSPQSIMERQTGARLPPTPWPWEATFLPAVPATRMRIDLSETMRAPGEALQRALGNGRTVLWPMERILSAASGILTPRGGFGEWLHAWLVTLWGLSVSALFGGTLVRMAALEFAFRSETSLRQALGYTIPRWPSLLAAPLATIGGLAFLWLVNFLTGLVVSIPVVGEALAAVLWGLPLLCGLLMAVIVLGVAAGWPFMFCTICIDGGDTFEALSRAYSYLFNRPWYALFLVLMTLVYGSVLLYFVTGVLTLAVDLTTHTVGSGMLDSDSTLLLSTEPSGSTLPLMSESLVFGGEFTTPVYAQSRFGLWGGMFASLPAAFLFSLFWTSTSIVYILLRRREDAIPLDEIDQPQPERSDLALSGIPAAERREQLQRMPPEPPLPPDEPD